MNTLKESNKVTLSGIISSDFRFSHEVFGEKFYLVDFDVKRKSDATDTVPLMISERLIDVTYDYKGCPAKVVGALRSYNVHDNGRTHLKIYVFVQDISEVFDDREDENNVSIIGFICKEPIYRKTPLGREVADVMIAINRPYGKSDYIPCLAWGRNAGYMSKLEVGTQLSLDGRIQSRIYDKRLENGEHELRTAYEVSLSRFKVLGANR